MSVKDRRSRSILLLALVLGLASIGLGLINAFGDLDPASALARLSWLPYALGGGCMLLAAIAVLAEEPPGTALEIFLLGGVGIAVVPLFWIAATMLGIVILCALFFERLGDLA